MAVHGFNLVLMELVSLNDGDVYVGFWYIIDIYKYIYIYKSSIYIYIYIVVNILRDKDSEERCGRGVLIESNGSRYDGYWKEDKKNGKGRLFSATDGKLYEGDWLDNNYHGYGIETWPDGAKYEGQYEFGKKAGDGHFMWADDSEYVGEFRENNIHGKGITEYIHPPPI